MTLIKKAHIEITSKCNIKCKHCYIGEYNSTDNYISIDKLDTILNLLKGKNVTDISISGGEPLIHPNFRELLAKIKELNFRKVQISTNGLITNEKILDLIVDSNIHQINFSLHGATPDLHSKVTDNKLSFYSVIKAISYLQNKAIDISISTTINRHNKNQLSELGKICKLYNIKIWYLFRFLPLGIGEQNELDLMINPTEHYHALGNLYKELKKYNINTIDFGEFPYFLPENLKNTIKCSAGIDWFVISTNGNIFPCTGLRELSLSAGNIFADDWKDITYNLNAVAQKLHSNKLNSICENCVIHNECNGGCRAASLVINKSVYKPDKTCYYYEKQLPITSKFSLCARHEHKQ